MPHPEGSAKAGDRFVSEADHPTAHRSTGAPKGSGRFWTVVSWVLATVPLSALFGPQTVSGFLPSRETLELRRLFGWELGNTTGIRSASSVRVAEDGSIVILDGVSRAVVRVSRNGDSMSRDRTTALPDGHPVLALSGTRDDQWLVASPTGGECLWLMEPTLDPPLDDCSLPPMRPLKAVANLQTGAVLLGRVEGSPHVLHWVNDNDREILGSRVTPPSPAVDVDATVLGANVGQLAWDGSLVWYADYAGPVHLRAFSAGLKEERGFEVSEFGSFSIGYVTRADGTRHLRDLFERTTGLVTLSRGLLLSSYTPGSDRTTIRFIDRQGITMAKAEVPFRVDILAGNDDRVVALVHLDILELTVYQLHLHQEVR